jgi:hypothetical protein
LRFVLSYPFVRNKAKGWGHGAKKQECKFNQKRGEEEGPGVNRLRKKAELPMESRKKASLGG